MFICIGKQQLCLWAALLLCFAPAAALSACAGAQQTFSPGEGSPALTVVVDAGHGGEDGGAVSSDGVSESGINLALALRVNDLLRFAGQRTEMTRREDVSLHSGGQTVRARKTSDLQNRTALVNAAENALLLSIHQNSLPSSPETRGAQAFYNRHPAAEAAAESVQAALNACINTHRAKKPRAIGGEVYLMDRIGAPGILVECGFLSNPEETARLQTEEHQKILTCAIVSGLLESMAGEGVS